MSSKKPLIVISNDDGITSKGIRHLVNLIKTIGEVVVVAPNSPQSGMGHAITIHDPLKVYRSDIFEGVEAYECSGTPADCVKLAKHHIMKNRSPDLVLSGINHGANLSVSVLYSGTMSAAVEASIEGMPAIGFSLCDYSHEADFSHTSSYILKIVEQALQKGIPKGAALNVNFPKKSDAALKGLRICRQAKAKWEAVFDERTDPHGRQYLWLTGEFAYYDKNSSTDTWAIEQNYISVTPVSHDMTDYEAMNMLGKDWTL